MSVYLDAMQFQMATPPTNRHKQFWKLRDGSSKGPAKPGQAVKLRGDAILIASSFVFASFLWPKSYTFGPCLMASLHNEEQNDKAALAALLHCCTAAPIVLPELALDISDQRKFWH